MSPSSIPYNFRDDERFMKVLTISKTNLRVFCLMFLPRVFNRPFSQDIHSKFFSLFDNPQKRNRCAIRSARGVGKTSLLKAFLLQKICWKTDQDPFFSCFVSYAEPHSEAQTEGIKQELRDNHLIQKIFGGRIAPSSDTYRKDVWKLNNGSAIACKGIDSQISGLNIDNERPNYFCIDDLTDPDTEASETQLVNVKRRFWGEVMFAIDIWGKEEESSVIVAGTIKGANSLLYDLEKIPGWTVLEAPGGKYREDGTIQSLWDSAKTDGDLLAKKIEYEAAGQLDVFEREILCLRTSPFSAEFKSEYWKYYEEKDRNLNDDPDIINVVMTDPGREAKPSSADTAIECWGIDINRGILYYRDCEAGKFHRDQIYQKTIDMAKRHKASAIGLEDAGLCEHVRQPFEAAVNMAGLEIKIEWLKPRGRSKAERASQLIYYYRTGRIYHNRTISRGLETQQSEFPNPSMWDQLDVAAYVVQMMEHGGIYFQPTDSELAMAYNREKQISLERLNRGLIPKREYAWKTVM